LKFTIPLEQKDAERENKSKIHRRGERKFSFTFFYHHETFFHFFYQNSTAFEKNLDLGKSCQRGTILVTLT